MQFITISLLHCMIMKGGARWDNDADATSKDGGYWINADTLNYSHDSPLR